MSESEVKRGPGRPPKAPPPPVEDSPVESSPEAVVLKQTVKVRAKRLPLYHPYQKVLIPVQYSLELPLDNWLKVQIEEKVLTQE